MKLTTTRNNTIFCIEQERVGLDTEVLDLVTEPEQHIGKRTDKHWIVPTNHQYPDPIDDRTYKFNAFVAQVAMRGYTDLMVIKNPGYSPGLNFT